MAAPGVAGAPVSALSEAAEEIDRNLRRGAERTAERGARLAAAQGLEVRPEAVQAHGNVWRTLLASAHAHRAASSRRTAPAVGLNSPQIVRIQVVSPEPFGPSSP